MVTGSFRPVRGDTPESFLSDSSRSRSLVAGSSVAAEALLRTSAQTVPSGADADHRAGQTEHRCRSTFLMPAERVHDRVHTTCQQPPCRRGPTSATRLCPSWLVLEAQIGVGASWGRGEGPATPFHASASRATPFAPRRRRSAWATTVACPFSGGNLPLLQ